MARGEARGMIAATRRSFAAALIGMGMPASALLALPSPPAAPPLRLPGRPLRLMRQLERGIGEDGRAAITVRRWWEVAFAPHPGGILATGRQIAAEVDAPPGLEEIAGIERQRDGSALFPLLLSEGGLIVPPPASPAPLPQSSALAAALAAAEARIAAADLAPAERARIALHLAELGRAGPGLFDTLPGDLLFPAGTPITRSESMALPGGLTGRFTLAYAAAPQPDAPWLAQAERRVSTMVGNQRREGVETWVLEPLGP